MKVSCRPIFISLLKKISLTVGRITSQGNPGFLNKKCLRMDHTENFQLAGSLVGRFLVVLRVLGALVVPYYLTMVKLLQLLLTSPLKSRATQLCEVSLAHRKMEVVLLPYEACRSLKQRRSIKGRQSSSKAPYISNHSNITTLLLSLNIS